MTQNYKGPLIVRSKNGDWFVKYWFEYPGRPGEFKEFRVRDGVNYIHDHSQKEAAIQQLAEDIEMALISGKHNPFEDEGTALKSLEKAEAKIRKQNDSAARFTMQKAMENFLLYCKAKNLSNNTVRTYKVFINNFTDWLRDTEKLNTLACEYLEADYYDFINSYYDAEDWSARTYNNHLSFLTTFFNRVKILERKIDRALQYEINLDELEYKKDRAEKNKAYTDLVAERVKQELARPEYSKIEQFVKFIYLSCMRPKEIRELRIENIDLKNRQIKVIGPSGKTGERFVPISDELLALLEELNFSKLPLNFYLFGRFGEPGEIMFGRTWFSDLYKQIKIKLGLDIHLYTMYGWKHTRVISLVSAGFKDEEVMKLTGHKDYQAFMAYKRDLVVDHTVMTGKTISW
ncbi:tyrosine-type recombinase/integrase [Pedobacter africanus]|uniref:Site-specific recombinase XerD n=1 Tax=Pedobacter africanus TaxID=151894 RepID=A0A1W1ZDD9_9SPHI|nr:tyrosine-type recombinase/integrase [Pedobacter africanus]SMC46376.1 Site-specific recombinase XerD [Pedobacter africanus]